MKTFSSQKVLLNLLVVLSTTVEVLYSHESSLKTEGLTSNIPTKDETSEHVNVATVSSLNKINKEEISSTTFNVVSTTTFLKDPQIEEAKPPEAKTMTMAMTMTMQNESSLSSGNSSEITTAKAETGETKNLNSMSQHQIVLSTFSTLLASKSDVLDSNSNDSYKKDYDDEKQANTEMSSNHLTMMEETRTKPMNFNEFSSMKNRIFNSQPVVNINDFFPSQSEDFKSNDDVKSDEKLKRKIVSKEDVKFIDKKGNDESIKASMNDKEIETTDDDLIPDVSKDDKLSRNKGKTGQDATVDEHRPKTNMKNLYVPPRIKKSDSLLSPSTYKSSNLLDFATTKFNLNESRKSPTNSQPEFSTTKFYVTPNAAASATAVVDGDMKTSAVKEAKKIQNSLKQMKLISNLERDSQSSENNLSTFEKNFSLSTSHPRVLSRFEEKLNSLDCDIQNLSTESAVWRGNETHELCLPKKVVNCSSRNECFTTKLEWDGVAEIQSGDILIVEIDDNTLMSMNKNNISNTENDHHSNAPAAVYQVTRLGHENCDITEGELLDITPLTVDGKKLVTLYDKDLSEGMNLLIVVSDLWGNQCVRLSVNVKSDNCGENADCSGKGVCFSNNSMDGYECECCVGFSGSHCEEIDACTPSPCTNNGICVDLSQGHQGNSYQCLCPYGYTGKNCEFEADPCNPSQCLHGGTCISNNTTHFRLANTTFPFRCECPISYTGPLCQHNLNECESSPCVHGICVDQEDGFRCFCQPGFSGDLCNIELNECDSNPCLNRAQCIDHIGRFSCQCTKGYQGKNCEIKIDFCANNPCEDGYRCVDHGNEYSCVCPGSNEGNVPDCHEWPRTLCTINPCENGGTCWTSHESYYCACRPGYTGKMCEENFVFDSVVSSSELLSDLSDTNVITFNEPPDTTGDDGSFSSYICAGVLSLILITLVVVVNWKISGIFRRAFITRRQLIQCFKRKRSSERSKHWLSGKNASFFEENHITLKNNQLPSLGHCTSSSNFFNRSLQTNLESDMYCAVDLPDEPLIH
ncbi:CLUMA_CG002067, isoform A [Clunio marinus]|uniref:CLUMA_CG002067, isoform A n=1 Tax=Clunio marinus TaxID=568069 RepID=A0A1J1HJQ1_9DIPT|nr:CLUMA_CG002067, isoform A [Clunio marinus]